MSLITHVCSTEPTLTDLKKLCSVSTSIGHHQAIFVCCLDWELKKKRILLGKKGHSAVFILLSRQCTRTYLLQEITRNQKSAFTMDYLYFMFSVNLYLIWAEVFCMYPYIHRNTHTYILHTHIHTKRSPTHGEILPMLSAVV